MRFGEANKYKRMIDVQIRSYFFISRTFVFLEIVDIDLCTSVI